MKRWLVLVAIMVGAALTGWAAEERPDKVVTDQEIPKNLDWGPEVAGTRVALEMGNSTGAGAKEQPMDAWIYVMNSGNSTIIFWDDRGDFKAARALTRNAQGELMAIGLPVDDTWLEYTSSISKRLKPQEVYRFSVELSSQVLQETNQQLFVGVNIGRMENGVPPSWKAVFSNGEPIVAGGAQVSAQGLVVAEARYPWIGEYKPLTPEELKVLQAARAAAESDPAVIAATQTYDACFAAADESIRAVMLKNPLSQKYLEQIKREQQVHDTTWVTGIPISNSSDILLPNPQTVMGEPKEGIERLKFSGHSDGMPAADSPEGIRRAAAEEPEAKALLQKVRDAYWKLDAAVQAAMRKNAAIDSLMKGHLHLWYGRRDLGLAEGTFVQV